MTTLAELTTLQVGGPAARVLEASTRQELIDASVEAWADHESLIIGGGSNLLVSDEGIDGTVVRVLTSGIERLPEAEGRRPVRIRVQAGETWDRLVASSVAEGWAGLEALSGIPGSVGAAPVQNIGAYGQELAESLVAIEFLDYLTGDVVTLAAPELGLGYRTSALKRGRAGVVLSVDLALEAPAPGGAFSRPIAYAQLSDALDVTVGTQVPLADVRTAVLGLRASKGMLLDPAEPESRSAGSFFTNPIVTEHFARGLPSATPRWPTEAEEQARVLPLGSPVDSLARPASGEYLVKLSAAWLIEAAGIRRGFALPGSRAGISSKHTLAIVNRGGATATEIVQLATFVQTRVLSEFGVILHPEPVLVGVSL